MIIISSKDKYFESVSTALYSAKELSTLGHGVDPFTTQSHSK